MTFIRVMQRYSTSNINCNMGVREVEMTYLRAVCGNQSRLSDKCGSVETMWDGIRGGRFKCSRGKKGQEGKECSEDGMSVSGECQKREWQRKYTNVMLRV